MAFPQTIEELKRAGYTFEGGPGRCRTCGEDIEWWKTKNGKMIPMNLGTAVSHFSTCPQADQHRSAPASQSKISTATLNMDWLKEQAKNCHCVVCKKITGR
jgi:hypothetical protein